MFFLYIFLCLKHAFIFFFMSKFGDTSLGRNAALTAPRVEDYWIHQSSHHCCFAEDSNVGTAI